MQSSQAKFKIFLLAAILVLIQAVFLFFSPSLQAQTSSTSIGEEIPSVEIILPPQPLSGTSKITARLNLPADNVHLFWPNSSLPDVPMARQSETLDYFYDWDTNAISDGQYYLKITATVNGIQTNSGQIAVTVANNQTAPQITVPLAINIISPADGEVVSGKIEIKAMTTADDSVVDNASLKFDIFSSAGNLIQGDMPAAYQSYFYTFNWDSALVPDGQYRLVSRGNKETYEEGRDEIIISVKNSPPPDSANVLTDNIASTSADTSQDKEENQTADSSRSSSSPDDLNISIVEVLKSSYANNFRFSLETSDKTNYAYLIINPETAGREQTKINGLKVDFYHYSFLWPVEDFPDGFYNFTVTAGDASRQASVKGRIKIQAGQGKNDSSANALPAKTASSVPEIFFIKQIASPVSGKVDLSVAVSQPVNSVFYNITGPRSAKFIGEKKENYYEFFWPTVDFPDAWYKISVSAEKDGKTYSKNINVEIKNKEENTPETIIPPSDQNYKDSAINPEPESRPNKQSDNEEAKQQTEENPLNKTDEENLSAKNSKLDQACRDLGIKTETECREFLSLELECRRQAIKTKNECQDYLYKSALKKECVEAGAKTQSECREILLRERMPAACQEAGIKSLEECDKKIHALNQVAAECQKTDNNTPEKCEKYLASRLPEECGRLGINNSTRCEAYLAQKNLPQLCLELGVNSLEDCNKIMLKKTGSQKCFSAGITDEQECQDFIFNKFAPRIECRGRQDWECIKSIKDRFLGLIIDKQDKYEKIKEKWGDKIGKSAKIKDLNKLLDVKKEESGISIKDETVNLKIIPSREKIILNETGELIQPAPIVLMMDSDSDGLPDDIEKRIGTDPYLADTDGDGYSDAEEIRNGYNPAGEGKIKKLSAPIDEAIINNKELGQPKDEGEARDDFIVTAIKNAAEKKNGTSTGYILSGRAEPNVVLALYIYSDLPLVVTVQTDEFGNWQYDLKKSLIDGEHEVYVTLNDNTGRVVAKSFPLSFFVKNARAISIDEALPEISVPEEKPKTESYKQLFFILAGLIMALGILLFIIFLRLRRQQT